MRTRLILAIAVTVWAMLPAAAIAQATAAPARPTARKPVTPPVSIQVPRAAAPAPVDPRQWPQAFSVVLVVGEMEGTQQADAVPPAARKALTDLKDFLPYKSYRLLDTQWTLCCGKAPLFSRLRGLDGQEYELNLTASVSQTSEAPGPTVNVQFFLAEARHVVTEAQNVEAHLQTAKVREDLRRQQELAARKFASQPSASEMRELEAELKAVEAQVAAGTRRAANRTVINTSFRMDVGETVVVGTSRIQGDKALIALLTAVPPKGAATR
jgi:hypothetical protein